MEDRKRITSKDVARFAGVSRATVSAVINKTRPVSKKLTDRVEAAMRELNYQPNSLARSLKGKRTHRIGLLVGNAGSPFWALVINTVERVAYGQGFHVMLGDSGEDPEKELAHLKIMSGERVDGIIIAPSGETNREFILRLASEIPVVLFDRRFDAPIDTVASDNELGAYLATLHLIETKKIEKIACLTISLEISPGLERLEGYRKALREKNIPIRNEWIKVEDYTEEAGHKATKELLQDQERPQAIFASSHLQAVGALRAIDEMCLKVPDDITIIGFDEMPWAAFLSPPLTVVSQPVVKMAAQATNLLLDRILSRWESSDESPVVEQILHRPHLIVRESCGNQPEPCEEAELETSKIAL
jgi:DNA-binding LacI/PurR family transcriptional regulator